MGKKSTPAAPDYTKLAEMTAASQNAAIDKQTAANRANQITPEGKLTWTQDKQGNWTQTTELNPASRALYDQQQRIAGAKGETAESLIGRMQNEYGSQIDWSSLAPWADVPIQAGNLQATTSATGQDPRIPQLNANMGQGAGTAAGSLDYGKLNDVGNADATRQKAYDNAYKMATSRLDPQWQQQESQMAAKLASQGITQGSDAYAKAMDQMARQRTDAYNQAMMGATQEAGQQAQIDYGINMGLRQEQAQEALNQANYGLQAQGQNFQQRLTADQANNAALTGQYGMGVQGAQLGMQRQQQAFGQNQAAGAQNFGQRIQAATFQNQQRQQQLTELMQKRGFSLNEINAILSGTQVGMPTFAGYSQAGAGQGVDYSGAGKDQYSAQMDAYNAAQAASPLNAAASLAGTAMKAYTGSDARMKREIRRVGTHPRGYGIFTYRFVGEQGRRRGVIAQDVAKHAPELVASLNGVLMVRNDALEGV